MRVGDYVQLTTDLNLGYSTIRAGRRGDVVRLLDGGKAAVVWFGEYDYTEVFPHEVSVLLKGD